MLPGVMGMEGFAEVASALAPGFKVVELEDVELLAPFKFYRDEPRDACSSERCVRDGGDGTLLADCELIGRRDPARTGRAGDAPLHRPRAACPQRARGAEARVTPGDARSAARERRPRGRLRASTSTAPHTRCSTARGATTATSSAGSPTTCPPTTSPPSGADGARAAADRAVLPDRGRVGARHRRPDGAADARRSRRLGSPAARSRARCGRLCHRATAASTPTSSTRQGACGSRLEGYRTTALPGELEAGDARPRSAPPW